MAKGTGSGEGKKWSPSPQSEARDQTGPSQAPSKGPSKPSSAANSSETSESTRPAPSRREPSSDTRKTPGSSTSSPYSDKTRPPAPRKAPKARDLPGRKGAPGKKENPLSTAKDLKNADGVKGKAKVAGKEGVKRGKQAAEASLDGATGGAYRAAKTGAKVAAKAGRTIKKSAGKAKDRATSLSGLKSGDPKKRDQRGKPDNSEKDPSDKNSSKSKEKNPGGKGEVSGSVKKARTIGAILLAIVALFMVMILGIISIISDDALDQEVFPTGITAQDELDKIKDCIPEEWIKVAQSATPFENEKEPGNIPWSMVAGIAGAQTMFGKKSPYDRLERYSALKVDETCFRGGGAATGSSGGTEQGGADIAAIEAGEIPPRFLGMLQRAGTQCGLPPWVLAGVARTESNWNPTVRNASSGAAGMTQFLDSTWAGAGKDFNGDGIAEVTNPFDNLWSGMAYMCSHYNSFKQKKDSGDPKWKDGDLIVASVQAHHDGPGHQLANGPGVDPSINQEEAQAYTGKVIGFGKGYLEKYPELKEGNKNAELPKDDPSLGPGPYADEGGGGRTSDSGGGTSTGNCTIPTDPNPIGGANETQGVGPFLLTLGAANAAREAGYDPQSPCVASWVGKQLSRKAKEMAANKISGGYPEFYKNVYYDPENEEMTKKYQSNRVFYQAVVTHSGLFASKETQSSSCALKLDGEPDSDKVAAQMYMSQIMYTFNCLFNTEYLLYTVQKAAAPSEDSTSGLPKFTTTSDRRVQRDLILQEALQFSYASTNGWKKDFVCKPTDPSPQGLIPLTQEEFLSAGYEDPVGRCDPSKSVRAAAVLFIQGEKTPVSDRDKKLPYSAMLGGWGNIQAAVGQDREKLENQGPWASASASTKCTANITTFVEEIAANKEASDKLVALAEGNQENKQKILDEGKRAIAAAKIKALAQRPNCEGISDQDAGQQIGSYAMSRYSTSGKDQQKVYSAISTWASALQTGNALPNRGPGSSKIERLSPTHYAPIEIPADITPTAAVQDKLAVTAGGSGTSAGFAEFSIDLMVFYGGTGIKKGESTAGVRSGSLANGDNDPFSNVEVGGSGGQTSVAPNECPPEGYTPPNPQYFKPPKPGQSIKDLCEWAVKNAPNPETAKALMWGFGKVGKWAYRMDSRRNAFGVADCSSFVSRAYAETTGLAMYAGGDPKDAPNPFTTHSFTEQVAPTIPESEIKPGDIGVNSGHIVFYLTPTYTLDTGSEDRPVTVGPIFGSYRIGRVDVKAIPKKDLYKPAPFIPGVSDQWVPKDKL